MADKENTFVTTITLALGLPVGSTESDVVAAVQRLRDLETQGISLCGVQSSAELIGAVRGLKNKADLFDAQSTELAKVKSERDKQNFDSLITQGRAACQLAPAVAKLYEEQFNEASAEGAGANVVAQLKGFLAVAPRVVAQKAQQPAVAAVQAQPQLTWNGKTYAELPFAKRAELAKADPELYRAMKTDHDAGRAA